MIYERQSRRASWLAFALLAFAFIGCEAPKFDVSGKVKYNGEVLDKPEGTVLFIGENGSQFEAQIGSDGTYTMMQLPKGVYKVAAYYRNPAAKRAQKARPKQGTPPPAVPASEVTTYITPEKFASPETSGFSAAVDKPNTVYDIELTGPKLP